jgi:lysophospholipase
MIKNITLSTLLFLGTITMNLAQETSTQYSQETQLTTRLSNEIKIFWQQGVFSYFSGIDQTRINYATFIDRKFHECIVLVTGRSESYLKYQELAFDLHQQGFNLFIIDHRGQGLSQRLLKDSHKGYVKNFDDYANDLQQFINDIVVSHCANSAKQEPPNKPHLLAHSMGGTIAVRMMQLYPQSVKSAVLTSPMIAINNGNIPNWLAKTIIYTGDKFNAWFSNEADYFIGQAGFSEIPFSKNELSQSAIRYQYFIDTYQKHKDIQLGGVTTHWLAESIKANKNIFTDLAKLSTPILLMQSGNDTVVSNEAQNDFCQQLHKLNIESCPNGKPFVIDNAFHELLFEQDLYRTPALDEALAWFRKHSD